MRFSWIWRWIQTCSTVRCIHLRSKITRPLSSYVMHSSFAVLHRYYKLKCGYHLEGTYMVKRVGAWWRLSHDTLLRCNVALAILAVVLAWIFLQRL